MVSLIEILFIKNFLGVEVELGRGKAGVVQAMNRRCPGDDQAMTPLMC